ncbi:MAG: hypothetical protein HY896_05395 [Deltaproteobacteria bacterium]|nr:hypothetical protein [Deltaproteobacteria bacterium]
MGSIYTGIMSKDGFVFATNDIFGDSDCDCSIVRVNSLCGGFIVTARGGLLPAVSRTLAECFSCLERLPPGITRSLAGEIIDAFGKNRLNDPDSASRPMPFLLLLIGYRQGLPRGLEHVFIRNRVTGISMENGKKAYATAFDTRPPEPAENLFYGHAELSRYLSMRLQAKDLDDEAAELLSYMSVTETQKIDGSMDPGIRMATLSARDGFGWLDEESLRRLSARSRAAGDMLARGLFEKFHA